MRGFTFLELLIVIAILAVLSAVAATVLSDKPSDFVVLKRSEWECVASAEREYTYYSLVGKISVQHVGRRMECTSWVLRR